jgi:predicted DNA-binding antitoxin AbrB/MazE fold protein
MVKIAFFYKADEVFNTTVKALKKRDFTIIESDEENKVIRARWKKGILKPSITMDLKVERVNDTQANLNIIAQSKGGLITPDDFQAKAEEKLINTLYRLFDRP